MNPNVLSFLGLNASPASKIHMVGEADLLLKQARPAQKARLSFQYEGVILQISHVPDDDGLRLTIWAELGYLPYSFTSPQRRKLLIAILVAARNLPHVRFGIDGDQQIIVSSESKISGIQPPEFFFIPLVSFIQEALPFIKLIGECI